MAKDIYEEIEEEDLTPDLLLISQVIGVDNVIKMLRELHGISFYIPNLTRLDNFITKYISKNRNKSPKIIARELGVTEIYLKKYTRRKN